MVMRPNSRLRRYYNFEDTESDYLRSTGVEAEMSEFLRDNSIIDLLNYRSLVDHELSAESESKKKASRIIGRSTNTRGYF
jgi:hypothetical protein